MQAFGGLVETGVGAGLTFSTGGVAGPLGWPIMAHGLDHYVTGMNTVWSGVTRDTVGSQLLQQAGMSHQTASLIDTGVSIMETIGGATVLSKATYSLPTKTMGQKITKNEVSLVNKIELKEQF